MSHQASFGVRAGPDGGEVVHEREYATLAEAVLGATRHMAANPGHVAVLHERWDARSVRQHEIRRPALHVEPEPWAALVHLEWGGADVRVEATSDGGARVVVRQGVREVVGAGPDGTAAAEDALRRWG